MPQLAWVTYEDLAPLLVGFCLLAPLPFTPVAVALSGLIFRRALRENSSSAAALATSAASSYAVGVALTWGLFVSGIRPEGGAAVLPGTSLAVKACTLLAAMLAASVLPLLALIFLRVGLRGSEPPSG